MWFLLLGWIFFSDCWCVDFISRFIWLVDVECMKCGLVLGLGGNILIMWM